MLSCRDAQPGPYWSPCHWPRKTKSVDGQHGLSSSPLCCQRSRVPSLPREGQEICHHQAAAPGQAHFTCKAAGARPLLPRRSQVSGLCHDLTGPSRLGFRHSVSPREEPLASGTRVGTPSGVVGAVILLTSPLQTTSAGKQGLLWDPLLMAHPALKSTF